MALIFAEGFDSLDTTSLAYYYVAGSSSISSSLPGGRSGRAATYGNTNLQFPLGANYSELYIGFAMYANTSSYSGYLLYINSSVAATQISLSIQNGGVVFPVKGLSTSASSAYFISSMPLISFRWYYIELYVKISSTVGAVTLKMNGITVGSVTGVNTENSNGTLTTIGTNGVFGSQYIDDIYVCDTTGSAPYNTFLNEIKCTALTPNGVGNSSQWTPPSGSNYQAVDEIPPDGDTTYVYTDTASNTDTYAMSDLASTNTTIHGVNVKSISRKVGTATRILRPIIRTSSTDYEGSDFGLSASYTGDNHIWNLNPNTASAWTPTEVNAIEAGVKLQS